MDITNEFIKFIAKKFIEMTPLGSCIARLSGSKFAIAREITGTHQISYLAQLIIDLFTKPFIINDQSMFSSVSIGIAHFPIDGTNSQTLITNADIALRRARESLVNTYQFYEPNLNQLVEARQKMMVELHYALERNELVPYYQPQIDLNNKTIFGVEVLLRWHHPEKGIIPPGFFIPLAEESGFIIPMSEWVLRTACEQALRWQEEGLPSLTIAVNLSARQFKQKNLVEVIHRILQETKLPHNRLELEITESIIVDNLEEAITTLNALRKLGLSIALDDFGTGYSSLSYLSRFPVQKLKIDQSFVRNIDSLSPEKHIIDIILMLAKNLNMNVIAEGIETQIQADFLKIRGCHQGQGYLYGKPMQAEEIVKLFKT